VDDGRKRVLLIAASILVYFDVPVVSPDRRIRAASLKTIW
jgi:hypothetical protein